MKKQPETHLQRALAFMKVQMAAAQGRELTLDEFAAFAGVKGRKMGDWIRGSSNAPGMNALFELLSKLPEPQAKAVLDFWQKKPAPESLKTKK